MPGFDEEFKRSVEAAAQARENPSPVDLLWATFRRGYALIAIFNALQPPTPLEINRLTKSESKREKDAAYKFVEACHHQLNFPQPECFMIQDLFSEDTSGFVKVSKREVFLYRYVLIILRWSMSSTESWTSLSNKVISKRMMQSQWKRSDEVSGFRKRNVLIDSTLSMSWYERKEPTFNTLKSFTPSKSKSNSKA